MNNFSKSSSEIQGDDECVDLVEKAYTYLTERQYPGGCSKMLGKDVFECPCVLHLHNA